jgi:hypothetical protein
LPVRRTSCLTCDWPRCRPHSARYSVPRRRHARGLPAEIQPEAITCQLPAPGIFKAAQTLAS